jgi:hypothetical protein
MGVTYQPTNVLVNVNGIPLDNLSEETFVSVAYADDNVSVTHSVDGRPHYSVRPRQSARVSIAVKSASNANALFSGLYTLQKKTGGGSFLLSVVDTNIPDGLSLLTAPGARVAKMPDQEYALEDTDKTWEIICGELTHFIAAIPDASTLPIPPIPGL